MNSVLSDYNRPGYIPSISRRIRYADLDISLRIFKQPNSFNSVAYNRGDLVPLTDIDAVKNSIKNICLTDIYERPFQPGLGSRIRHLLFENVTPMTAIAIAEELDSTLRLYEPRIAQLDVKVKDNIDSNSYFVSVTFSMANFIPATVEFIINRLR